MITPSSITIIYLGLNILKPLAKNIVVNRLIEPNLSTTLSIFKNVLVGVPRSSVEWASPWLIGYCHSLVFTGSNPGGSFGISVHFGSVTIGLGILINDPF